jgi:dimeric dUTPase (all-alpha-NTP-PPase superfamily)
MDHKVFLPQRFCAAFVEAGEIVDAPKEKRLEEYVDCFHFLLSIHNALDLDYWTDGNFQILYDKTDLPYIFVSKAINRIFKNFIAQLSLLANETRCFKYWSIKGPGPAAMQRLHFANTLLEFFRLGHALEFSAEQIIEAYMDKNNVNYKRQEENY